VGYFDGTELFRLQLHQNPSYAPHESGDGRWRNRSALERGRPGNSLGSLRTTEGGKNSMNSAVQTFANLFFLAFSILLIAAAFLAPRGRGELGARLKRVALLIAGLIGVVSTILLLTSK
jgi:hypothetical protein